MAAEFLRDADGAEIVAPLGSAVRPQEDYLFRRLPRPPEGYPQCGCSLEDMAATTSTGYSRSWRMHAYGSGPGDPEGAARSCHDQGWRNRNLNPNFCTRRGLIDVLGTPMCSLHAGQIALKILLGEEV